MRIANLVGRAVLLVADGAIDIHKATGGSVGPDPGAVFEHWEEVRPRLAALQGEPVPFAEKDLEAPVPSPRQIFAIGINYEDHAAEAELAAPTAAERASKNPERPVTFTKFASCLTGPVSRVALPGHTVDWEVELVAVIGRVAHRVSAEDAWAYVAGLTVGQDLTERLTQWSGPTPQQFCLGKSFPGFGPTGPAVVTLDEFDDPADLRIGCSLNGVVMQDASTGEMTLGVPELVAGLSAVLPLLPGDLVFTGTPAGIGATRVPPIFLKDGDELVSRIEGIGALHTAFEEA
jgi:2-keto-4-pentenoate hydratase/2-oxohepta-3-ene-1,7-dioic acid hydratase in catechol pathway